MTQLTYKMDSRWEGYIPPKTQQTFVELADGLINPSENVPEIIRKKLNQVKSLLIVSAIDYELQDVAEFMMYTILEYAIRDKYESVNQKQTKKGLSDLLKWAKNKELISIEEKHIKFLVTIRNEFAHLKFPQTLDGVTASYLIEKINELINELYRK